MEELPGVYDQGESYPKPMVLSITSLVIGSPGCCLQLRVEVNTGGVLRFRNCVSCVDDLCF